MPIDLSAVTLTELRYVVALAEQRHFGRAAAACFVTQPTLSAQVQKLERTLGLKIFERNARAVHVTPVGEEIVAQARAVLEAAERIVDLAQSRREPLTGTLRLGVIPTLSPYLLPWLVPPLRPAFPRLRLVFRELKTAEILAEIAQRRLDCGILALPVPATGLVLEPLFDEPFWLLVAKGHPLAQKTRVRESDLVGEKVLLLDEGHCLREQALSICARAGTADTGRDDFRATSIETLRHMVAGGMGATLIPALALKAGAATDAAAVPFAAPAPSRRMALVWRARHPQEKDHRALAAFIREHLPEGVQAVARR